MNLPDEKKTLSVRGLSGQALARMIFKAELPEQQVRALPVQSLYMAVKQNGLLSSVEIVNSASIEQCRLMLDFDLWHADTFHEENFWEWLALPDAEQGSDLAVLQKILKCIDLKIIAVILSRYVQVEIHDEPADSPPGPHFHTPDNGRTWLHLNVEDAHKHFLLGRLLALIFETSVEVFYQLIAVPNIETQSALEEQAFDDKLKRLSAEGIPDREFAYSLNSPLPENLILRDLSESRPRPAIEDLEIIEPLVYQPGLLQPLSSLLAEADSPDEVRSEITLITNAAIVRFHVDYFETSQVADLLSRVRGAMNLGLQAVLAIKDLPLKEIHSILGLQKLYRFGLYKLMSLRELARNAAARRSDLIEQDQILAAVLESSADSFPCVPVFFRPDGSIEEQDGSIPGGTRAIETMQEYTSLMEFLRSRLD